MNALPIRITTPELDEIERLTSYRPAIDVTDEMLAAWERLTAPTPEGAAARAEVARRNLVWDFVAHEGRTQLQGRR